MGCFPVSFKRDKIWRWHLEIVNYCPCGLYIVLTPVSTHVEEQVPELRNICRTSVTLVCGKYIASALCFMHYFLIGNSFILFPGVRNDRLTYSFSPLLTLSSLREREPGLFLVYCFTIPQSRIGLYYFYPLQAVESVHISF